MPTSLSSILTIGSARTIVFARTSGINERAVRMQKQSLRSFDPEDPQTGPSEAYVDAYYLDIALCSYKLCIRSVTCKLLHEAATVISASWL
jgi:hypothetical protein